MKISTIGLIVLSAVILCTAAAGLSQAEYRFGPWVYWAPYYYPSPAEMQCLGFKPEDFAPRYQSPNPLPPPDCPPPPRPPLKKRIAEKRVLERQLNGPVMEVPTRVPVRPRRIRRPTHAPRGSQSGEAGVQSLQSTPPPPRQHKRLRFGLDKPQPVRSAPGS